MDTTTYVFVLIGVATVAAWPMHPVQAAPRQSQPA